MTTNAEALALDVAAAAALDAVELLELLPHAATSKDAVNAGTKNLVICRMLLLSAFILLAARLRR